jgi:hypothetical protein
MATGGSENNTGTDVRVSPVPDRAERLAMCLRLFVACSSSTKDAEDKAWYRQKADRYLDALLKEAAS